MPVEVTFREGRPVVGYLYLERRAGDKSHRTALMGDGLVVDYAEDGRPIGIEITAPSKATPSAVNKVLEALHLPPASEDEFRPLAA